MIECQTHFQADTPRLEIEAVSKSFGYRIVLADVTLRLNHKTGLLLLGRNGTGKSTLLRIICGLIRPQSGSIRFEGENTLKVPEQFRQSIGVISHATGLYGALTARENLLFYARLRRIKNAGDKIGQALVDTGLEKTADIPVKAFSSGMNKRLNIAQLMVSQPSLLLLDEPYSGLDIDSAAFFTRYLEDFKSKGGSILIISHQIENCLSFCDTAAVLDRGMIKASYQIGDFSAEELIQHFQAIR